MALVKSQDHPRNFINGVQFRIYSSEEVKRLSVMEVTNPTCFDALLHPTINGLYDLRLGAGDRSDICRTCNMMDARCPGHMGHISLPLPLFNPFLFRFTYQLFRGTCMECHSLLCPSDSVAATKLKAQLKCLEAGNISVIDEISCLVNNSETLFLHELAEEASTNNRQKNASKVCARTVKELNDFVNKATRKSNNTPCLDRNIVTLRYELIREFCKNFLFRRVGKCLTCGAYLPQVRQDLSRSITLAGKSKKQLAGLKQEPVKNIKSFNTDVLPEDDTPIDELMSLGGHNTSLDGTINKTSKKVRFDVDLKSEFMDDELEDDLTPELLNDDIDLMKAESEQRKRKNAKVEPLTAEENLDNMPTFLAPGTIMKHFQQVWEKDAALLCAMFPVMKSYSDHLVSTQKLDLDIACGTDLLFLNVVPILPTRFRPCNVVKGRKYEHLTSTQLSRVLADCILARQILHILSELQQDNQPNPSIMEDVASRIPGKSWGERLNQVIMRLQSKVNCSFDSDLDATTTKTERGIGLKQVIEKKGGLFRKNIMGKRVNYCCRSVISPDPFIEINEIGIPEVFADRLTFPESVAPFNAERLRKAVLNGPFSSMKAGGGAVAVTSDDGNTTRLTDDKKQRAAASKRIFKGDRDTLKGQNKVLRSLRDGDPLLLNRQPTLHKPSIMGHRAKILHGQKTIRLNYAVCKSYNADFDGDEMNAHFPQSYVAHAEAYELADVIHQYLVPKDGTPISGLIQDHVVAGVLLTMKDSFLTREDYFHLVYNALRDVKGIRTVRPAILKPRKRYTGKQVISTILLNLIDDDRPKLNLTGKAKTSTKNWQVRDGPNVPLSMSESEVVIRQSELLVGVLDKAHYGSTPYSLVHCVFEIYGAVVSAKLLSCFSRLFTIYLQTIHGFTLGVEDIVLIPPANIERQKLMKKLRRCGPSVVEQCFNLAKNSDEVTVTDALEKCYCNRDPTVVKELDFTMKVKTDGYNNRINSAAIPFGLLKTFPQNSLQLMIESGAKGSMVNGMQISGLLGQIELEGCRMPLTVAGRTVPSFKQYDPSARAGGFIDGRFLSGISPPEYYFHCMAGREGLIDTAVKTSRSGYLQRCIIKHLEGIVVNYDLTVRDADQSIVQFKYGEDGLDVCKTQFLSQKMQFLLDNYQAVEPTDDQTNALHKAGLFENTDDVDALAKKVSRWKKKRLARSRWTKASGFTKFCATVEIVEHPETVAVDSNKGVIVIDPRKEMYIEKWMGLTDHKRLRWNSKSKVKTPVNGIYSQSRDFGTLPEKLHELVDQFANESLMNFNDNQQDKSRKIPAEQFQDMLSFKALNALVVPGEPVGLLAAQSIGEPSTQMTLNTFHFAGRGEMNVTLGIPRLREILMIASKKIATPLVFCTFKEGVCRSDANRVRKSLDIVRMKNIFKEILMKEVLSTNRYGKRVRRYEVRVELLKSKDRSEEFQHVTCKKVLKAFESKMLKQLNDTMADKYDEICKTARVSHRKVRMDNASLIEEAAGVDVTGQNDVDSDDDPEVDNDAGDAENREKRRHHDDNEYEGEEDENIPDDDVNLFDENFIEKEESRDNADVEAELDADESFKKPEFGRKKSVETPELDTKKILENPLEVHTRIRTAMQNGGNHLTNYEYDVEHNRWCQFTFEFKYSRNKIDMAAVILKAIENFVVRRVPNIEKAIVKEESSRFVLQTQGINLQALFHHGDVLELSELKCNCIYSVLNNFGVEAAQQAIVKEMKMVFGSYGINVDNRHLSLVADYMCLGGDFKPFNRYHMAASASSLQRMTFETSINFLRDALINSEIDDVTNPSARLVIGRTTVGGTGSFELRNKITATVF